MIEFYGLGFSPFTCPVELMLDIKGVDYDKIIPDRDMIMADAFVELSPMRKVPVVVIDGTPVSESIAIGELLEELYPQPRLLPDGALERARVRMHASMASLYIATPSVHMFSNRRASGGTDVEADARAMLTRGFAAIESAIEGGRYATGGQRSMADCILAPALHFATGTLSRLGFEDVPAPGPDTGQYFQNIGEDAEIGACLAAMSASVDEALGPVG